MGLWKDAKDSTSQGRPWGDERQRLSHVFGGRWTFLRKRGLSTHNFGFDVFCFFKFFTLLTGVLWLILILVVTLKSAKRSKTLKTRARYYLKWLELVCNVWYKLIVRAIFFHEDKFNYNNGRQARSQPVFSGKPEGPFCLSCTFIFQNERNWMKKNDRVPEKLVSPGLPGLQVATRLGETKSLVTVRNFLSNLSRNGLNCSVESCRGLVLRPCYTDYYTIFSATCLAMLCMRPC